MSLYLNEDCKDKPSVRHMNGVLTKWKVNKYDLPWEPQGGLVQSTIWLSFGGPRMRMEMYSKGGKLEESLKNHYEENYP